MYSTYLGGQGSNPGRSGAEIAYAIEAVDQVGSAYVTGFTQSPDFPIVGQTFVPVCDNPGACADVFVTKFSPDGKSSRTDNRGREPIYRSWKCYRDRWRAQCLCCRNDQLSEFSNHPRRFRSHAGNTRAKQCWLRVQAGQGQAALRAAAANAIAPNKGGDTGSATASLLGGWLHGWICCEPHFLPTTQLRARIAEQLRAERVLTCTFDLAFRRQGQ